MATINVPYQNLSFAAPDENEVFRLSSNIDPTGSAIYSRKGDTIYNLNLDEIYNNIINPANRTATQGVDPGTRKAAVIDYLKQQGIDYNSIAQQNYIDLPQWFNVGGFKQGTTTDLNVFKPSPVVTGETRTLSINPTNPNAADLSVNGKIVSAPPPAPQPGAITPNFSNPQSLANPNANFFQPGQGGNPTPQQQNKVTATPTPQQPAQTYTIQSGDTLSKLAAQYGTTVGALMSLNPQITDANKIYSGQKINLTPSQVSNTQNIQQQLTGAMDEATRIQQEIQKLNSPANTGTEKTPDTSTGETPGTNSAKVYTEQLAKQGAGEFSTKRDAFIDEQKTLTDKKNEEAQNINNNPWYSQGKKQLELQKLDSKYELKLNTASNLAKYYDAKYQDAVTTAKYLTGLIQDDTQFAIEQQQKKLDAINALSKDNQVVSVNGREVLVNKSTGKVVADLGASKVTGGDNKIGPYTEDQLKAITKINQDVSKNSTYTKTTSMRNYGDNVIASLSLGSGVGDIAAINQFQKVIDEGAVTRDQDVRLIQSSQSLANTLKTKIKNLEKGEQLSPELRKQMREAVEKMYAKQVEALQKDPYIAAKTKEATLYGITSNDTILGELGAFTSTGGGTTNTQTLSTEDAYAEYLKVSNGSISPIKPTTSQGSTPNLLPDLSGYQGFSLSSLFKL